MDVALTIYLIVGCFWFFIALFIAFMNAAMGDDFSPLMARFMLAAFVWPLVVVGAVIWGLYAALRVAWPEEWVEAHRARKKRQKGAQSGRDDI